MLSLLVAWRKAGGNLLDLNGDGKIDNPGAAIMDAAWPKIAAAAMRPELGPPQGEFSSLVSVFDSPPGGQFSGWYQYFDRDIPKLLHIKQPQPFANEYCGAGNLRRCQQVRVGGDRRGRPRRWPASSTAPTPARGTPAPRRSGSRTSRGCCQYTMAYTNRPSGIQQVISFNRHR